MNRDLKRYLDEIAKQLWNKKACLFVGSGFSRNAKSESGVNPIPLWNDLGDRFFEELMGRSPKPKDRAYVNVMKLAEDVQNVFDRTKLNDIIIDSIADRKREPTDLYYELLSLPWVNIYTTNYDTLLERSAGQLKNGIEYSIVDNETLFPSLNSPSIIKLHGSLSNIGNIVITEEDYRKYPSKHQLFINNVQHAFVHNTIVVLGFSGDDPNFLQWTGWVKDNIGECARKIYLIAATKIKKERIETLKKKNISVVDITRISKNKLSVSEKISMFLKYLDNYGREDDEKASNVALMWGKGSQTNRNYSEKDYMTLYEQWKNDRACYPGWLVLPRDKREYFLSTNSFSLGNQQLSELKSPYDILFLNEFNWRIERFLYPMHNDWEPLYLSVLNKYDLNRRSRNKDVVHAMLNLKLSLLKLYRQENWESKWIRMNDEIDQQTNLLDGEQFARLKFEQCWHAIYNYDFSLLLKILESWPENPKLPDWEMKKASIWAEFISLETGKIIAENAFKIISSRYESCSMSEKYFWASRKNAAYSILNLMYSAGFSDNRLNFQDVQKAWAELKKFDDIWYEREFFDVSLRYADDVFRVSKRVPQFELGMHTIKTSMSGNSMDWRIAYAFFNYYEELGYPVHLPYLSSIQKESTVRALSLMTYCSPAIAYNWLLRCGDPEMVEFVLSRKYLVNLSSADINALYDKCLNLFSEIVSFNGDDKPNWMITFASILPEMLSRLCMKADYDLRVKTLSIVNKILPDDKIRRFRNFDKLVSRLMSSFSLEERYNMIPHLIEMNVVKSPNVAKERYEPMSYFSNVKSGNALNLSSKTIEKMISAVSEDKDSRLIYVIRLVVLFKLNLLTARQESEFGVALWKHVDDGFPKNVIYSKFSFLCLPHPEHINPQELLKQYFYSNSISINTSGQISFSGHDSFVNEVKGTVNDDINFEWNGVLLDKLVANIYDAWINEKELIHSKKEIFGWKISEEYKLKYIDIGRIISTVIARNRKKLSEDSLDKLHIIIENYSNYGLPVYSLKVAFPEIYDYEQLQNDFVYQISSFNKDIIKDCISALLHEFNNGSKIVDQMEMLTENFRTYSEKSCLLFLEIIEYILRKDSQQLSSKAFNNILIGLDNLYNYTIIETSDTEDVVNEKLNLQKEVAPIVSQLLMNQNYMSSTTLNKWKNYFEEKEIFHDIKNNFYSYVD